MFAVGLPWLAFSFFTVASVMIAIPSGIQIVSALTTMWLGKLVLKTPMLYVIGFVIVFVLGGLTGVMLAVVPFNLQTHDTYFVVAHFHYVLIGGAVFPLFGGFFYWFPKITGRLLNETLGKLQFWLFFIGFNVAFLPMHLTGFLGMPRRVYTYLPGLGWDGLNVISTIGAFMIAASILLFIAIVAIGLRRGEAAGDNPWNAGTLEWATASPPPPYNFRDVPVVHSREPLWDEQPVFPRDAEAEHTQVSLHGHDRVDRFGLRDSRREAMGSTTLDAIPEQRVQLAKPSIKPLLTAFAVAFTFMAVMIDLVLVPVGAVLVFASIVAWHWPEKKDFTDVGDEDDVPNALPSSAVIGSMGGKSPVWLGMVLLVLIEAVVFASLISSYLYLRSKAEIWPLDGLKAPDLLLPTLNAVLLIASVVPMHLADRGIRRGNQNQLRLGLIAGFVMAAVFLGIKVYEYSNLDYNWATNAYGSMVWTITGFHSAHVIALLLKTIVIIVLAFLGYFTARRYVGVTANSLYWYFVVAVWIPLFALLYLLPNFL
jgi:cytochrome c oxidase subunit 1/cytochrome c oxidase subunit I+III